MNTKPAPVVQAGAQHLVPGTPKYAVLQEAAAIIAEGALGLRPNFMESVMKAIREGTVSTAELVVVREILNRMDDWRDMASAPVGDASACIDIWCGEEECRYTDCFWSEIDKAWVYEDFDGGYVIRGVKRPVAWMPTPGKPEGV